MKSEHEIVITALPDKEKNLYIADGNATLLKTTSLLSSLHMTRRKGQLEVSDDVLHGHAEFFIHLHKMDGIQLSSLREKESFTKWI